MNVIESYSTHSQQVYAGQDTLRTARLSWNGRAILFQKDADKSVYSKNLLGSDSYVIKRLDGPLSSPNWWYTYDPYSYTNDIMYVAQKPGDSQARIYHRHYGVDFDKACNTGFASQSGLASIQVTADRIILFEQDGKILRTDCDNPSGGPPLQINAAGSDPRIAYRNHNSSGLDTVVYWSSKTGNGDIYSVNLNGQNDTRLTNDNAFEGFPVLSPDNDKIAYVSDKDSPNHKKDIWVMDVDGKNPVNITNTPDIDETSPDWSAAQDFVPVIPITGRVVYVSDRNKINFMSLNNQNISTLYQADSGDTIISLKLSWDGSQVLFQTERNRAVKSLVIDNLGRGYIPRLDPPVSSPSWLFNPSPYAFTNDIMYVAQKEGDSQPAVYHRHYGVDFDKACSTRFGSGSGLSSIHVTADRIILFERSGKILRNDCDNPSGNEPLLINSAGSDPRMAYKTSNTSGSDKVVYWSSKTGNGDVYSVNLNGQNDTRLTTDNSFDGFPVLSPTSDKVLFVSSRSGSKDIYIMNADGSNQINLTNTPNIDETLPDWSSGNEIVQPPSSIPPPSFSPPGTSVWPNYEKALYIATQIDADTYLSKAYKSFSPENQDRTPDWTYDGCSVPHDSAISGIISVLPDSLKNILDPRYGIFVKPCIQHDFGYRNVSEYEQGHNEDVRKLIDDRMYTNMLIACGNEPLIAWNLEFLTSCQTAANVYYTAVRTNGSSSYLSDHPVRYH